MISEELKKYLNHTKDGYFEFKDKNCNFSGVKFNVDKYNFPDAGSYFVKEIYGAGNGESEHMVCAEVLLNRVYQKLGLKSVEYYPLFNSKRCVISKAIQGENICSGEEFFEKVSNNSAGFDKRVVKFADEYSQSELDTIQNFLKYADEDFLRQLFITRGFDLATFNYDRNLKNFFVESDETGLARNMILLDNEASGCLKYRRNGYYNDFTSQKLYKDELIRAFRQNEDYQQYITRFEIAETIATAPFNETTQEVKDEIGFVVDAEFLENVKMNSYKVAEELVK